MSLTVAETLGATKTSFLAGNFSSWNTTLLSNGVKIPISRLFADIQASFELQPQEALSITEYKSLQRISSAEDFSVAQYVEAELKKSEGSYRPREMTASDRLLQASFPSVFNADSPQRKRQKICLSSSAAVIMDSSPPASSVDPLSGLLDADADADAGEDDANHNGLKTPPLRREMSRVQSALEKSAQDEVDENQNGQRAGEVDEKQNGQQAGEVDDEDGAPDDEDLGAPL